MKRPMLRNPRRARAEQRRRLAVLAMAFVLGLYTAMAIEAGWTRHNAFLIAGGL